MSQTACGRTVLVTGCSSGIGLEVARGLHRLGYRVFATVREAGDASALESEGIEVLLLDLRDSASVQRCIAEVSTRTGGTLYGLFNNGAYGQPGAIEDLSREILRDQFEVNVFGWHELTNAVLPMMRRAGEGRIIQNSSLLGLVALRFRGAYTASKYALEGLTDTLRLELDGTGVHVSLIEPGPVLSRFRANAYAAFQRNIDVASSPFHRQYRRLELRLANDTSEPPFTLPPSAVLKRVVHALQSPRPRPRYYVTVPTYLLAGMKRLLSSRWMDVVLLQVSRRELKD